jgi:hypothetical protein
MEIMMPDVVLPSSMGALCLITDASVDEIESSLRSRDVEIEKGMVTPQGLPKRGNLGIRRCRGRWRRSRRSKHGG